MRLGIGLDTKISKYFGVKQYAGLKYGIELEYENARIDRLDFSKTPLTRWRIEKDDSLRNHGIEFVSRPTAFDKIDVTLDQALAAAAAIGCRATPRCGLHVHVNMTDRTFRDLYNLTVLYTLIEPVLFAEFANGRQDNHFCVPTYTNTVLVENMYTDMQRLRRGITINLPDAPSRLKRNPPARPRRMAPNSPMYFLSESAPMSPGVMAAIQAIEASHKVKTAKTPPTAPDIVPAMISPAPLKFPHVAKYAALNFSALRKFGTLEYRQHPATTSKLELQEWIGLIDRIHQVALLFSDPLDIIQLYDEDGLFTLCEKVGLKMTKDVDKLDLEDAVDAATMIAGHEPVEWTDLKWEIA